MLYEAAQAMMRSKKWSWLKAWAMQIARRCGMKKAIVALARRLAVIMHRIWVDGTEKQHGNRWVISPARDPTPGPSPVTSAGERVSRQCPGSESSRWVVSGDWVFILGFQEPAFT
jgi:hypothetical protein